MNTTAVGIGTGAKKTTYILSEDAKAPVAKACANYRGGGKKDWYLPCKEELNEMYRNKEVIGAFSNDGYWSSTEWTHEGTRHYTSESKNWSHVDAWNLDFSTGEFICYNANEFGWTNKPYPNMVRPIRAF